MVYNQATKLNAFELIFALKLKIKFLHPGPACQVNKPDKHCRFGRHGRNVVRPGPCTVY